MKSLPDKEHRSAKGSCGRPPGASQLLGSGSGPFLKIFSSFPFRPRRNLCRRLTVNLSLGAGNDHVYIKVRVRFEPVEVRFWSSWTAHYPVGGW